MKRIAMAALAAAGLALSGAPAEAQRNGLYDVAGTNPDGSSYTGVMAVQQVGLASWQVAWQVGENRFEGYGMSAGPVFSIGFTFAERPGIAIYQVFEDGTLSGQWTLVGTSAIGTERLTPRERPASPRPATPSQGPQSGSQSGSQPAPQSAPAAPPAPAAPR